MYCEQWRLEITEEGCAKRYANSNGGINSGPKVCHGWKGQDLSPGIDDPYCRTCETGKTLAKEIFDFTPPKRPDKRIYTGPGPDDPDTWHGATIGRELGSVPGEPWGFGGVMI